MWRDSEVQQACTGRPSADSIVLSDDCMSATSTTHCIPPIGHLNVTKSVGVHVGPKIVNVTQNVHNSEVIKGRLLCAELTVQGGPRRLRCSVAVFVCWALVLATALICYLIWFLVTPQSRLDIALQEPWYLRRQNWQALPPFSIEFLKLPVKRVVIGHSVTAFCNDTSSSIIQMQTIQKDHFSRRFGDIGPNYLVSGNALVFEGRGANVEGVMISGYNRQSITISFLGDYSIDDSNIAQFEHVSRLLEVLVSAKVLQPDYTLHGFCQLATSNVSPGQNIMKNMHMFKNWSPNNQELCLK